MTDNQAEQLKANSEAEESAKQKGLSKEAWAAMSAIAVALIGGIVAITTVILNKQSSPGQSPSTPPLGSPTTSGSSSVSSPPTVSLSAQRLAQVLDSVNIDFSEPKLRSQLNNPYSKYPQFAEGCLKLLDNQRLKKKAYFDVIFWNYTEVLKGRVTSNSPDGSLDTKILKNAIVEAYETRNGFDNLSFEDVVEPKQ